MTSPSTREVPSRVGRRRERERAPAYRGDIEGLRAVAVLLVVVFHAGWRFVPGGYVGVDVFFVLSGFLITGLLLDELRRTGRISLTAFYARRVRRLLPLAALVLVVTVAATYLLLPPLSRASVGADVGAAALGVANWHFALEATQYMTDAAGSPVLHFWSLGVEEQFYVVWPLLLIAVSGGAALVRRRWDIVARRVVLVLALLAAVSLVTSWRLGGDGTWAYYGLHTRAWELAAGGLLAAGRSHLPRLSRNAARVAGPLGLLMVVASAVLMDAQTPFPGTAALVPVLGTVLLVASGARLYSGPVPRLLRARPLRFVGRISYAWYLWHWPCLVIAQERFGSVDPASSGESAPQLGAAATLGVVALSFALSVASHVLVEQRVRHARPLVASQRRTLVLGGAVVAAVLVTASALWLPPEADSTVATGYGLVPEQLAAQDAAAPPSATTAPGSVTPSLTPSATPSPAPTGQATHRPMTIEQARADQAPGFHGCYGGYRTTAPAPTERCRLTPAGGRRTIALVGDSHAAQWAPAFVEAARRQGWTLYYFAKTQCSAVDVGVYLSQDRGRYTACDTWRRAVLRQVAEIDGLDALVVGRWMRYHDLAMSGSDRVARKDVRPVWQDGVSRMLKAVPAVPQVIVLADTPWPGFDVPSCLSKAPGQPERCSFSRSGHVGLDADLVSAERATGGGRVSVLDLTSLVCPQSTCPVVTRDGTIVYRDAHHLTATYSTRVAGGVAARVAAALETGS